MLDEQYETLASAEVTGPRTSAAGLLVPEEEPWIRRGIWTFRPDAVADLAATIRGNCNGPTRPFRTETL